MLSRSHAMTALLQHAACGVQTAVVAWLQGIAALLRLTSRPGCHPVTDNDKQLQWVQHVSDTAQVSALEARLQGPRAWCHACKCPQRAESATKQGC